MRRVELGGERRDAPRGTRAKRFAQSRLAPRAALARVPAGVDRVGDLERRIRPAERGARRRDFLFAERRAVRVGGAGLVSARPCR